MLHADTLLPGVAQDEVGDSQPLFIGEEGLHRRLRDTRNDPTQVILQPVAVAHLDRFPCGLEDIGPVIFQLRGELSHIAFPRPFPFAGAFLSADLAKGSRQHRRVAREYLFFPQGRFRPNLRPADGLVTHPERLLEVLPGGFVKGGEHDALYVCLVKYPEKLGHGIAAVGDLSLEPVGHGGTDVPGLPLQPLRQRAERRLEALREDGLWQIPAQGDVDGILFQLPGTVAYPVAVLGDDEFGAHVVDGIAEHVGSLGPEEKVVGGPHQGHRQLGDQPLDVGGHVDDDHVPRRQPHVDQDVRQAVDLPPDLGIGVGLHVHVLAVLLVFADVYHAAFVDKALFLELVEDRPGGVDPSVLEAADHRVAGKVKGDGWPLAPRVGVDHVELELLGMGQPGATHYAPAHLGLHERPDNAEFVGDPSV